MSSKRWSILRSISSKRRSTSLNRASIYDRKSLSRELFTRMPINTASTVGAIAKAYAASWALNTISVYQLPAHRRQELGIRPRLVELVDQQLHALHRRQRIE